jgi:hypothetical protein
VIVQDGAQQRTRLGQQRRERELAGDQPDRDLVAIDVHREQAAVEGQPGRDGGRLGGDEAGYLAQCFEQGPGQFGVLPG